MASVKTYVWPVQAIQVTPTPGAATAANQVLEIAELVAINAELDNISGVLGGTVVDQIDTTPLLDTSSTNIPASSGNPVTIVASLAANVTKLLSVEDIGEYIGVYTGVALSEVLVGVLPLGGGEINIEIPAATRVSLRAMENVAISSGKIAINFIG